MRNACMVWCLVALGGCASSSPGLEGLELESLPTSDDYDFDTVYLELNNRVTFRKGSAGPVALSEYHRREVILRPDGRYAANFSWQYTREFSELLAVDITVVRPDGETTTFGLDDMSDQPISAMARYYDDARVVRFDAPEYPVGTVVDTRVRRLEKRPDLFAFRHSFGRGVPVLQSRFEVRHPVDWEVLHRGSKAWRPVELPPREEREGDSKLLVWEQSDIEAIPDESGGPSIWDLAPMVATRLASWQIGGKRDAAPRSLEEYSQWIVDLQRGTAKPTPEIEQKVRELLKDAPDDPRIQARILHDWVKRNIRYVAIEIGLGGWRPYTAEQVFEWRYGDCKDMSTLLKAMLNVAGIDSHMVTLFSHRGVPRDFVLPALGFTNHAILGIDLPGGLVVVDPTEGTVPFGELPPRDQEARLLVNHSAKPYVYESPPSEAHSNLRAVDATFRQSEEDPRAWTGQIKLHLKGAYGARFLGRMLETSGGEQGGVIAGWSRVVSGRTSGHGFHEAYEGDQWSASAIVDLDIARAGSVSGNRLVLRSVDLLRPVIEPRTEKERKTSLVYSFRRTNDHRVRLELREGTEVRSLPDRQTFETKFGTYAIEWAAPEPGILELRRHFVLAQRTIPPDEFEAFKGFIEQVLRAERQAVVLGVGDA